MLKIGIDVRGSNIPGVAGSDDEAGMVVIATGVGLLVRTILEASEVGMTLVGGAINDGTGLLERGCSKLVVGLLSGELVNKVVPEVAKLVELVSEVVKLDKLEATGVEEMISVTVTVASILISTACSIFWACLLYRWRSACVFDCALTVESVETNHCSYSMVRFSLCSSVKTNPSLLAINELFSWVRTVVYGSWLESNELQAIGKDKIVEKLK